MKHLFIALIILIIDFSFFKGTALSAFMLMFYLAKLFVSLVNRNFEKNSLKLFFLYFIGGSIITCIYSELNDKIKSESITKYNEVVKGDLGKKTYILYKRPVSIYKQDNKYVMFMRLYNFEQAYYKDNKWIE